MLEEYQYKRRKKLIESCIPTSLINEEAQRRKQRAPKGLPNSFHKWWAQKPMSIAKAVLFAQLVDDPIYNDEEFPTQNDREVEQKRLFSIMENISLWENLHNEELLNLARQEIKKSWIRFQKDNKTSLPMPRFLDPFAGGGSLPISAQWLGLSSLGSDLNPVAVLINKCKIELPYKFANLPQISPENRDLNISKNIVGNQNLKKDIIYYGKRLEQIVKEKIGEKYNLSQKLCDEIKKENHLINNENITSVAWIWCKTVASPNPGFSHCKVPLASSFLLSNRNSKKVFNDLEIKKDKYKFQVKTNTDKDLILDKFKKGTTEGKSFKCILSGDIITHEYIRSEGKKGNLDKRLMAIVADTPRGRIYISPESEDEILEQSVEPKWYPSTQFSEGAGFRVANYGAKKWSDIFTKRQLLYLTTTSDEIRNLELEIQKDALSAGYIEDSKSITDKGIGAKAYSQAISSYLACVLDRMAYYGSSLTTWLPKDNALRDCMPRQSLAMSWEFAECNPFGKSSGSFKTCLNSVTNFLDNATLDTKGESLNRDICLFEESNEQFIISTDPPYFDAIGFADLSDFFYVWQRSSLKHIYKSLYSFISTPKDSEIVSNIKRHGGKSESSDFFMNKMSLALTSLRKASHPAYPITIYYAFKQIEKVDEKGFTNTGWEAFLSAIIKSGMKIISTLPMQTEGKGRIRNNKSNALTSSIIMVCEPKSKDAPIMTKREFRNQLFEKIPKALDIFESQNMSPVDIAQAIIGPGMEIFSSASKVIKSDDTLMNVREAIQEINSTQDEVHGGKEESFDVETKFALTFYETYGYQERSFGEAEVLANALNISVEAVTKYGIFQATAGKVKLLKREDYYAEWLPSEDRFICSWEATQYLIKRLEDSGEKSAALLFKELKKLNKPSNFISNCRSLAFRLYTHCEKIKKAEEALSYNGLIISWAEIERLSAEKEFEPKIQSNLF